MWKFYMVLFHKDILSFVGGFNDSHFSAKSLLQIIVLKVLSIIMNNYRWKKIKHRWNIDDRNMLSHYAPTEFGIYLRD